jgi:hypothetical protein
VLLSAVRKSASFCAHQAPSSLCRLRQMRWKRQLSAAKSPEKERETRVSCSRPPQRLARSHSYMCVLAVQFSRHNNCLVLRLTLHWLTNGPCQDQDARPPADWWLVVSQPVQISVAIWHSWVNGPVPRSVIASSLQVAGNFRFLIMIVEVNENSNSNFSCRNHTGWN